MFVISARLHYLIHHPVQNCKPKDCSRTFSIKVHPPASSSDHRSIMKTDKHRLSQKASPNTSGPPLTQTVYPACLSEPPVDGRGGVQGRSSGLCGACAADVRETRSDLMPGLHRSKQWSSMVSRLCLIRSCQSQPCIRSRDRSEHVCFSGRRRNCSGILQYF